MKLLLAFLFVFALAAPAGAQTAGSQGDYQYCGSPGTDADYQYCGCANQGSADADYYTYCASAGAGKPVRTPKPVVTPVVHRAPAVATGSTVGTTLPVTGGSPFVIALFGLALLLIGTGGRLATGPPSARAAR